MASLIYAGMCTLVYSNSSIGPANNVTIKMSVHFDDMPPHVGSFRPPSKESSPSSLIFQPGRKDVIIYYVLSKSCNFRGI